MIRERAKDGTFDAFKKGPGRPKRDPNVVELETELHRTNKALRELAIENTRYEENRRRLTGPIRGMRLSAEVKRFIVRAVTDAKSNGISIANCCDILMVDARRVRRWIRGRDPQGLTNADLADVPPIAKVPRTRSPRCPRTRSPRASAP
ncbi:hypothetical protein BH20ACT23_BH20ACT23_23810 [soil metagenome]